MPILSYWQRGHFRRPYSRRTTILRSGIQRFYDLSCTCPFDDLAGIASAFGIILERSRIIRRPIAACFNHRRSLVYISASPRQFRARARIDDALLRNDSARAAIKIRRYAARNARITATITTAGYERRRMYGDGMFVLYFCNLARRVEPTRARYRPVFAYEDERNSTTLKPIVDFENEKLSARTISLPRSPFVRFEDRHSAVVKIRRLETRVFHKAPPVLSGGLM